MNTEPSGTPSEQERTESRWEVWRQDESGNEFKVEGYNSPEAAGEVKDRLESAGHKQTYWVKDSTVPDLEAEK